MEEVEVRRAAWYERAGAWKAAEGDEGAEMVGEDEVSMSRQHRSGGALAMGWRSWGYGWRGRGPQRTSKTVIVDGSSVVERENGERTGGRGFRQAWEKKGAHDAAIHSWRVRSLAWLSSLSHAVRAASTLALSRHSLDRRSPACRPLHSPQRDMTHRMRFCGSVPCGAPLAQLTALSVRPANDGAGQTTSSSAVVAALESGLSPVVEKRSAPTCPACNTMENFTQFSSRIP